MEQLTLEQVSTEYSLNCFVNNPGVSIKEAFKAGAEWQKEQYKLIKKAMQIGIACLQNAPERQYEIDILTNACNQIPN